MLRLHVISAHVALSGSVSISFCGVALCRIVPHQLAPV